MIAAFFSALFLAALSCTTAASAQTIALPPKLTDVIWFETPIAEISVGYDKTSKTTLQRSFFLAYVGPLHAVDNPQHDTAKLQQTARDCSETTAHPLRDQLQQLLTFGDNHNAGQDASTLAANTIVSTNTALLTVASTKQGAFFACLRQKGASQINVDSFYLTLVQRNCTAKSCSRSGSRERLDNDAEAAYFSDLYLWLSSKISVERRDVTGLLMRLDALTNPNSSVSLQADVIDARETLAWSPDDAPAVAAQHLAALIEQVRGARRATITAPRVAPFAALSASISRQDLVTVADALADPTTVYALLPPDAPQRLVNTSDEVSRSVILDCRYYHGAITSEQMKQCSGFEATNAVVHSCLSGALCRPSFPAQIPLSEVLMNAPTTLSQLAVQNAFPREAGDALSTLKAQVDQCNTSTATADQIGSCFIKATVGTTPDLAPIATCLAQTSDRLKARCALHNLSPASEAALACTDGKSTSEAASCVVAGSLPPKLIDLYNCLEASDTHSRLGSCSSLAGGGAAKLAACLNENENSLSTALCLGGDRIPQPLRDAATCVVSNSGFMTQVAVCLAASQAPPRLTEQIGCLVESEGSPVAAGVCIATSTLRLTPEQQLALQCLATTGGQPYAFAACLGGQLTMREMVKCKGQAFGKGDCFGPHNTIQELARSLTGSDISSESVVGQTFTVGITPATYVVAVVEPIVNVGMNTLSGSLENAKSTLTSLSKGDFGGLARGAVQEITSPLTATKDLVHQVLGISL